jgi:hypothetical protein
LASTGLLDTLTDFATCEHAKKVEWVGVQKFTWLFDLPMWSVPAFLAFGAFSAWKETI